MLKHNIVSENERQDAKITWSEDKALRSENGELSDRKKLILKAVVESHIENGEPVGSKYLTQNKAIAYSSATIRNEMAELEELGYLEQPHTSAGRIPSENGYRFYVEQLAERYTITSREVEALKSSLKIKQAELDGIMAEAVRLASSMTNYAALAIKSSENNVTFSRYELFAVDEHNLILAMIGAGENVKTRHIKSTEAVSQNAIAGITALCNEMLTGITAEQITLPLMMKMERRAENYDYLVSPIVKSICETLDSFTRRRDMITDGINRLLSYPEYCDIDRLRDMLALFEQKDELFKLMSPDHTVKALPESGVKLYIGRENPVIIMDRSTLVFKPVSVSGQTIGAIGVVGPTRMDYSRVIATVDRLTREVTEMLSEDPAALPSGEPPNKN